MTARQPTVGQLTVGQPAVCPVNLIEFK